MNSDSSYGKHNFDCIKLTLHPHWGPITLPLEGTWRTWYSDFLKKYVLHQIPLKELLFVLEFALLLDILQANLSAREEKNTWGRPVNTRGGAYPGCSLSWSDRGSCSQGPTMSTPFIAPSALLHLQRRQWETSRDQRSRVKKSGGPFHCHSPRNEKESVCVWAFQKMSVWGSTGEKISISIYLFIDIYMLTRIHILTSCSNVELKAARYF